MDTLQAIEYLIVHGCNASEWQQAGMWNAVCKVVTRGPNYETVWTDESRTRSTDR